MAASILVMGLPLDIKFSKLLKRFRVYFKKMNIQKFWIRDTERQPITIEFMSIADAKKARNYLNNLSFPYESSEYPMEVLLDEGGHFGDEEYERRPRPAKRNRPRSRSPGYSQEASKLDMEIQLLRKQRQVIEEERRLLVEQKKLDLIREYGASASREFDDFDNYIDYEPPRKKRQPVPVAKIPRQMSPPAAKAKKRVRSKGLPAFFQPCKVLIADMKPYIEKGTTPEEVGILVKLIRAAIRKDLAITLDGKAFMPAVEILKLYRESHPKEGDKAFVAKILDNIRASYLTTEIKVEKEDLKEIKKEVSDAKGNENETDDKKATENDKNDTKDNENDAKCKDNAAGDEVANKIATKDTTVGENETDATAPDVAAKTELNTIPKPENISAGNLSEEVKIKTNDDTLEAADTLGNEAAEGDDAAAPDVAAKTELNSTQELENISAGNLSEQVKIKTNDDTLDEAVDALGDEAAEGDDWVEDWTAEEPKVQ